MAVTLCYIPRSCHTYVTSVAQIMLDLKYFSNLYLKILKGHHLSHHLYARRQSHVHSQRFFVQELFKQSTI